MKKLLFILLGVSAVLVVTGSTLPQNYTMHSSTGAVAYNITNRLDLIFAGDIMAHDVNYTRKPYYNIYEGIQEVIWGADLSFANLEFVFDPEKPSSGYPYFNAPPDYVEAAVAGGFNVFSLANNHSLDQGRDSAIRSIQAIEELAASRTLYHNGLNLSLEGSFEPTTFEVKDCNIGFLAVTSFLNKLILSDSVNVVPFYDDNAEDELVRTIRGMASKYDLLILSYHGGLEYNLEPTQWKQALLKRFIDAGVDIVWAHHPHVIQPWETFRRGKKMKLILYSTGNLISGQTWSVDPEDETEDRYETGQAVLFQVSYGFVDGVWSVISVFPVPIVNYRDSEVGMVVKMYNDLDTVDMSDEWRLYYRNKYDEMKLRLFDKSACGFVP